MQEAPWQDEVAQLLEHAAQALRNKSVRRAVRAFGTAFAYLELARENGDRFASELLSQISENAKEGPTERFTFQPGELEKLSSPVASDEPPRERSSKKKKK